MISRRVYRQRGFVLVMMGLTAFALFGIMGLALDVGRMYIAKNEAQTYADAGAVEAALRMNGTSGGIMTTAQLVAFNSNRYGLGNTAFTTSNVVLDYSTARTGPFGPGAPGSTFASSLAGSEVVGCSQIFHKELSSWPRRQSEKLSMPRARAARISFSTVTASRNQT